MPSIISGNTNATVYAIAERAATLIGRYQQTGQSDGSDMFVSKGP